MSRHSVRRIAMWGWALVICAWSCAGVAESFGDTTITLQSSRYYAQWDLTRLVYRVKSAKNYIPDGWILGIGACIADEHIDEALSTEFTWADEPFRGLRFASRSRTDLFTLWLKGQWDVGSVDAAVEFGSGGVHEGTLDGPLCEGSSISVFVLSGDSVEFPPLIGAGTFSAATDTQLTISSTSSGWSLGFAPTFLIPDNAERSVVERVFQMIVAPHGSEAGTTQLSIAYELSVSNEDFAGLPHGTYVIGIVYTVTADN